MNTGKIKPTVNWMSENYDKMNQLLFFGQLGKCNFTVFTNGVGCNGKRLGFFTIANKQVKANISRQMFVYTFDGKQYVNEDNFYDLCSPTIGLNGNYSASEDAWLNTLVHEMVHYADYCGGNIPKQGHGPRFRQIATDVSIRSNGRFLIKRLADADEMKNFELDQDIQNRNQMRKEKKKLNAMAIFVYRNKTVGLTIIKNNNEELLNNIYDYNVRNIDKTKFTKMFVSTDPNLIEFLSKYGYNKIMRTYRYWDVTTKPWLGYIGQFELHRYNGN